MTPLHRHHRRGMTLVELLVVIAIIGLLSAAVLPNLASSAGPRKVRETARSVSSFIAGAQSQAIGSRGGAGVWFDLLANPIVDDSGIAHAIALDLSLSEVPVPYSGELANSRVFIEPIPDAPPSPAASNATLAFSPSGSCIPPDASNLLIRFGTSESSFLFGWTAAQPNVGFASVDASRNQSGWNTAWPVTGLPGAGQGGPYEVLMPPRKNPVRSLTVESGMAIDLTWTFIGSDPGNWPDAPGSTLTLTQPVQLLYSTTGKPATVISNGSVGIPMLEPFYVLVTSIEAIQEGTAFTTSRSYWVAVDPSGGIPRVAEVQPITLLAPSLVLPTNRAQLEFTQQFIRDASLQVGG
ncbi:MAG: type II secretion system protein [Planctomycetota bacterium]|nr:type II secretion system protein [Planctomycetota bacterium]